MPTPRAALALVLALVPSTAMADDTWEDIQRYWSTEVGVGFHFSADLTGNVRDIARAYASGEVGADLPLGAGFFFRSIVRVPLGKVSPALLARISYASMGKKGELDGYGEYIRSSERLEASVGLGVCVEDTTCAFGAYAYKSLHTADQNYPITALAAALGDREDFTVSSFTSPYLGAILGQTLVDALLSQVDFENQRVAIDTSDQLAMQGGVLSVVTGVGERITLDVSLGYLAVQQTHAAVTRVHPDLAEDPERLETFEYTWDKGMGTVGMDLGISFGLLPERMPVQLALGFQGSVLTLVDLDGDRSVGAYINANGFLSAKW